MRWESFVFSLRVRFERFVQRGYPIQVQRHLHSVDSRLFFSFNGGSNTSKHFCGFPKLVATLYPFLRLTPLDLGIYRQSWNIGSNNSDFLEFLSKRFPSYFRVYFDWIFLETDTILDYHGGSFFREGTILELLQNEFPQFFWEKKWRFPRFSFEQKRRMYIDELVVSSFQFVSCSEDLLEIDYRALQSHPRGWTILRTYKHSPSTVFEEVYQEIGSLCSSCAHGYWRKRVSLDRFLLSHFEYVETQKELGEFSNEVVSQFPGGSSLLSLYNGSLSNIICSFYPELVIDLKNKQRGYWKNVENRDLISKIIQYYHVRTKEDWYRISLDQFQDVFGKFVDRKNYIQLLNYWNPEEDWNQLKFSGKVNKRSRQRYLGIKLQQLFKNEVLFEEYPFKTPNSTFIFDFYFPGRKLVIEYQGEQHYNTISNWLSMEQQKRRDQEKSNYCTQNGLTLLHIPYWWDNSITELQKSLHSLNKPIHTC